MNTQSDDVPVTNEEQDLEWPQQPSAILIMGKRQGTKRRNKQLWGRIALATALWYSAPVPKPYLMFVASDVHGRPRKPDTEIVKSALVERFYIPPDFLIMRQKTNCTLLEVRAARAIHRAYGLAKLFAVTHLYHAPRTQSYFDEVLPEASVIPVHPAILDEINFPEEGEELLDELRQIITVSQPNRFDMTREHLVEWILIRAHKVDPRGRLERVFARILRPTAY